jgi:hypothetical protein
MFKIKTLHTSFGRLFVKYEKFIWHLQYPVIVLPACIKILIGCMDLVFVAVMAIDACYWGRLKYNHNDHNIFIQVTVELGGSRVYLIGEA